MGVPPQLQHGSRAVIKLGYGGKLDDIITMGVDGIIVTKSSGGKQLNVTGRGWATKMLSQWNSDSSFDYWSQSRYANDPITREENIIARGSFGEESGICINEKSGLDGIMYSVANPSRGMLAKAKFSFPDASYFRPVYGFILNFYQESKAEAAERLGISIKDVKDTDYGYYGIGVVLGKEQHSGSTNGCGIWLIENSVWTKMTSFSQTLTHTSQHWLAASYDSGVVTAYYRLDSTSTWSTLGSYTFSYVDTAPNPDVLKFPSYRDGVGRIALYMFDGATSTTKTMRSFDAEAMVIPVEDPRDDAAIPPTGVIKIDDEEILLQAKSVSGRSGIDNIYHIPLFIDPLAPNGGEVSVPTGYKLFVAEGTGSDLGAAYYDNMCIVYGDVLWPDIEYMTPRRIDFYNHQTQDYWEPNTTSWNLAPPDHWQYHIGDLAHGAWRTNATRCFFHDGSKLMAAGSYTPYQGWPLASPYVRHARYSIVHGLVVAQRGYNGTSPSYHSINTPVTATTILNVKCHWWEAYTGEQDMTFEWVAKQLCGRSGITDVTFEKAATGSKAFTRAAWDLATDISTSKAKPGFILNFSVTSGTEVGVFAIETGGASIGTTSGAMLTISSGNIKYYDVVNGTSTLKENFVYSGYTWTSGTWTFSAQDKYLSVWFNKKLMATFYTGRNVISGCTVANGNATIVLDWPELDKRIDNYIFDMGSSGEELMRRLIGEKRIFYLDTADGGIRFFRNRTSINTANTADAMVVETGDASYDTSLVTRVRLEGAEAIELLDATGMNNYGNLFSLANSSELETISAFNDEATLMLADAIRSANGTAYTGAADLRVEPQDKFWIVIDGSAKEIIVNQCDIKYAVTQSSALLDMQISGDDV